jgi:tetratricopeptide (TPR) repeat protein
MIENEIPVNRQMIGEIYELIDIFPYFQSAHMLLLKGLYENADVKFENQLRNSAIHICNRQVLYWMLKTKAPSETKKTVIKSGDEPKAEIVSDTEQTVIESAKNSDLMITEIEKNSDEPGSKAKQNELKLNTGHSVMVAAEPDNTEPDGVIFLQEDNIPAPEDKVFFMDPGFSVPDRSDLLELDEEDVKISPVGEASREFKDQEEKKNKKQSQAELIEKFIIANPRIEPHKDKSIGPANDLAWQFVEEEVGLVTETLARIYINQGYYSKAIDIYEKLSLKFPEKSSYFASQIEKVKGYLKK